MRMFWLFLSFLIASLLSTANAEQIFTTHVSNSAMDNGDVDNAKRLFNESIALLKKNGADQNIIKKYFISHHNFLKETE